MQQYFVNHKLAIGMEFDMTSEQARHISTVLRMKEGKIIRLVDIDASTFYGSIMLIKNGVRVRVTDSIVEERESRIKITLAMALIKGERWDWLLEKATECGVSKIVPFTSARCIVKDKPDSSLKKLTRYRKIMTEAAEQSYRHNIPEIVEPILLKQLKDLKSEANFVAYEKDSGNYLTRFDNNVSSATIVIGPEGGFENDEIEYLINQGFTSVSLGKRIFRAETAAIAACIMLDAIGERHD
jgi:16S rRNA (uracil1498-N3)-methyltransferase